MSFRILIIFLCCAVRTCLLRKAPALPTIKILHTLRAQVNVRGLTEGEEESESSHVGVTKGGREAHGPAAAATAAWHRAPSGTLGSTVSTMLPQ